MEAPSGHSRTKQKTGQLNLTIKNQDPLVARSSRQVASKLIAVIVVVVVVVVVVGVVVFF